MSLHENFRDYTKQEISDIKAEVCIAHKCPYLSVLHDNNIKSNKSTKYAYRRVCDYILFTGKQRDCMPDECIHWNDKDVPKNAKYGEEIEKGDYENGQGNEN